MVATVLMIFPKLYQPEKSQPNLFFLSSSKAVGLFLEWACNAATSIAVTLTHTDSAYGDAYTCPG